MSFEFISFNITILIFIDGIVRSYKSRLLFNTDISYGDWLPANNLALYNIMISTMQLHSMQLIKKVF